MRQSWLTWMLEEGAFPANLIAVEKELHSLPHLARGDPHRIPNRRIDILVYAKGIHPDHDLFPLLIVECKIQGYAETKIAHQVLAYNSLVRAPFAILVSGNKAMTGVFGKEGRFQFFEGFLSYPQALSYLMPV